MRCLAGLFALVLAASPALADTATRKPVKTSKTATKSGSAKTAAKPADPAPCKKRVVGKGLDRKVVCEFTTEVIVKAGTPKPDVMVVTQDGRSVTGRPKSEDRLNGLSPRLQH
ncbi:MAG TPA: hypothetical protein VFQ53_14445 [Kofleriaceae bacterium]|nr:hypothetical protein [Kofleriaceae bacterium]